MSCEVVKVSLFWYPADRSFLVPKQKEHRGCALNLTGELAELPDPTLLLFLGLQAPRLWPFGSMQLRTWWPTLRPLWLEIKWLPWHPVVATDSKSETHRIYYYTHDTGHHDLIKELKTSLDAFLHLEVCYNTFAAGSAPDPLGELTALPRPPVAFREGSRTEMGKERGGEVERERRKWDGRGEVVQF